MKKFSLFTFLSCFCSGLALADAAGELSVLLRDYETMSGDFQQTLVDEKQTLIQESSGHFVVKKPGFFYWDTKEPFPQLLVSNLKTIWLFDPDLDQVTVRPYKNNIDQTPILLLSGDTDRITESYSVSKSGDRYTLKPRALETAFTQMELVFDGKLLASMILHDTLQQTSTFRFTKVTLNEVVSPGRFQFTPPDGVDILIDD